jgi:hypothetical protein
MSVNGKKGYGVDARVVRVDLEKNLEEDEIAVLPDEIVLQMCVTTPSDIVFMRARDVRNLYVFSVGEKRMEPLFASPIHVPHFFYVDASHNQCLLHGELLLRVGHAYADNYLWHVPVGKRNISPDSVLKEKIDSSLYAMTANRKIRLHVFPGETAIAFESGEVISHLDPGAYCFGRTKVVWFEKEKKNLCLGDEEGNVKVVLNILPEKAVTIAGFNESLGIVCLEGKRDL